MPERLSGERVLLIRLIRNVAGFILITAMIAAIAIAAYALWDLHDVGEKAQPTVYARYKPEKDQMMFDELVALNDEVIGWINIYGTNIDYPVVQAEDNEKYLTATPELKYSLSGSIFLDYRNHPDFTDFNNIIYGHSMDFNAMFGDVSDFAQETFFHTHPYGDLFFEGKHHGLRIVGFVETDAYKSGLYQPRIYKAEQKEKFLEEITKESKYPIAAKDLRQKNTYVLLSTCTSGMTNGRHILVCILTDEVYENPFAGEVPRTKDTVGGPRLRLRLFLIVMGILLALVMAAIVTDRVDARLKRKPQANRKNNEKKLLK